MSRISQNLNDGPAVIAGVDRAPGVRPHVQISRDDFGCLSAVRGESCIGFPEPRSRSLRLGDALSLATAVEHDAQLITLDQRLRRVAAREQASQQDSPGKQP